MRTTVLATLLLSAAAPLAAQVRIQQNVAIISGDTTVTIQRGDRSTCSVRIGDRTLDANEAERICELKGRDISVTTTGRASVLPLTRDSLRWRFGILSDSLMAIERRTAATARELAARQRSAPLDRLLGELTRVTSRTSMIGVSIDPRPRDTDRWGAYVAGVTPNYPAEKAGLRTGDIITSINGETLTWGRTERAATDQESLVWLRLSEKVRRLEPGKAVDLEYRRDGRVLRTKVTPVADARWLAATPLTLSEGGTLFFGDSAWAPRFEAIAPVPSPRGITIAPTGRLAMTVAGLPNFELAPMNEALGRYFGTSRGVLVLDTPAEKNLGLEPGDVVTNIDGRTVDTPTELIRVLRTYDRDKSFTIQVIRQKQTRSVTATLP